MKNGVDKRLFIVVFICLLFLISAAAGAFLANWAAGSQKELNGIAGIVLNTVKSESIERNGSLSDIILKYGKYIFAMWCLGFISPGVVFIIIMTVFRGMVCGASTAAAMSSLGAKGIAYVLIAYMPQGAILVPAYIAAAYFSIEFVLLKFKKLPPKARLKREKDKNLLEYTLIFAAITILLIVASVIEYYIIPIFL